MIARTLLDEQLSQLPLYVYTYIDPAALEFSPLPFPGCGRPLVLR